LTSRPPLPKEGPLNAEPAPAEFEAPEASDNQDGDEAEGFLERSDSTVSPPLTESETQGTEKKRKRTEDLTSSGTSNPKDVHRETTAAEGSNLDIFGLLDSYVFSHLFSKFPWFLFLLLSRIFLFFSDDDKPKEATYIVPPSSASTAPKTRPQEETIADKPP
jgi:hypothetical protein